MSAPAYRWVADDRSLGEVLAAVADEPRYALDTEFHRERTYWPRPALVQLAWPGAIALLDPLAVDLGPLAEVLRGPGLAVLHAAQQDLEVLDRLCSAVPTRLFDTQIGAGFLGWSSPSLANLVAGMVGAQVPKSDRLTDWLARPLTDDQLRYAASDVEHLLELHDRIEGELAARGRSAWAADECERLRCRPTEGTPPDEAWLKLKDARSLKPRARGVARAVAAWRDRRAMAIDQPARFVLADLAVVALAQRAPTRAEDLRAVRGVEDRHTRGEVAKGLLAAIADGLEHPIESTGSSGETELERSLRPAVTLVSAWVAQVARAEEIDTALLATRADLVELLAGSPDARLGQGWRGALVGEGIRALVAGESALAFSGRGRLRLLPVVGDAAVGHAAGGDAAVAAAPVNDPG